MITCKQRLTAYFLENGVSFETVQHRPAYTAHDIAAQERVSSKYVAKVVMVSADGKITMLVLPATLQVDFDRLREILHAQNVHLAPEQQFSHLFPDCEVGAMPPFGNLYDVPVYVDRVLTDDEEIIFNAGTHTETIRIRYADYVRLVKPVVASFGIHKRERVLHWSS
ncbi:MAG: YbaK/EbsC family protein [Chloroflexi bacterium]|nr:YbaK/EbsC family protein [Chloroflexota bacterium]